VKQNKEMNKADLENKHVIEVYDKIGNCFSNTRHTPWSTFKNFLDTLQPYSYVLDAGCGNGKNMMIRDDLITIGCDTSQTLIDICHERGLNAMKANIMNLPFSDKKFDVVFCVAVLHHVSTPERRDTAINEMLRVLKNGGKLFIIVWALEQNLTHKFLKIQDSNNDYLVSWKNDLQRFYHLFDKEEVEQLCKNYRQRDCDSSNDYHLNIDYQLAKDNWHIIITKDVK